LEKKFVKIGSVDSEIIGLQEIFKNKKERKKERKK